MTNAHIHDRLDAHAVEALIDAPPLVTDGAIDPYVASPYDVTGPRDLSVALQHRRELESFHALGDTVPTDVCLWAPGSPRHLACTKVGGDPYLIAPAEWPCDAGGTPLVFWFQICFAESRDVCPDLPGDVMLVFLPESATQMSAAARRGARIIWQSVSSGPVPLVASPRPSLFSSFHATLVRTVDAPEMRESLACVFDDDMDPEEEAHLGDVMVECSHCAVLKASKIGGCVSNLQRDDDAPLPGTFLAQLVGIRWSRLEHHFVSGVRGPTFPTQDAMRADPRWAKIRAEANEREIAIADCGVLGVFLDDAGGVELECESH